MAEAIGEDCELIEFGSGSGLKTRLLARAAPPAAGVSPDRHLASSRSSDRRRSSLDRFPALDIIPVHADFTAAVRCCRRPGRTRARRVVYFPGSTIGNFSPTAAQRLLRSIAALVGDGGGLLIGFDLDKDESIVWPAYNDRHGVSAAFNLNLLARINRELDADFDLDAFAHRADYLRARGAHRDAPGQPSRPGRAGRRPDHSPSMPARRSIPKTLTSTHSSHFARLTARAGFTLVAPVDRSRTEYFCVQYLTVD